MVVFFSMVLCKLIWEMKDIDTHPEDKVKGGQGKEVRRLVKAPRESWFPDSFGYSLPHRLLLPLETVFCHSVLFKLCSPRGCPRALLSE